MTVIGRSSTVAPSIREARKAYVASSWAAVGV
jgi:hypothetical protein